MSKAAPLLSKWCGAGGRATAEPSEVEVVISYLLCIYSLRGKKDSLRVCVTYAITSRWTDQLAVIVRSTETVARHTFRNTIALCFVRLLPTLTQNRNGLVMQARKSISGRLSLFLFQRKME